MLSVLLISCSALNTSHIPNRTQRVIETAEAQGFEHAIYPTKHFKLTAYQRFNRIDDPKVHVYIEGDGNSWKTRYQLSNNPTPKQPLALQLALSDPAPNVIYIARPCQYTPLSDDPQCDAKFWSSHRYAPEVIASVNAVLDAVVAQRGNKKTDFLLVGFSGGASVALLTAGQRKDVTQLITVAGDLNHTLLNEHHRTSPLKGSLNPSDNMALIAHIPQTHWCGTQDGIVPCWTVEAFCKKMNNPALVQCHSLHDASHHSHWVKAWPDLLSSVS